MIGEYVKIKLDGEVRECQVLCFTGWDTVLDNSKSTLMLKPKFLGYRSSAWPNWLETLFLYGILTLDIDDEDKPVVYYDSALKQYTLEERDVILRYTTSSGNVIYQYMSREEYDAADKEEYHDIKF